MNHQEIAERIIGNIVQASHPTVSPDGTKVAFVVTRTHLVQNTYLSQIWMASSDGSAPAGPVTGGEHDIQPSWSPDGRALVFIASRGTETSSKTLHILPLSGGETRTIATMSDDIDSPRFSPDGRWIAFTARTPDARYEAKDETWQAPRKIERFFTRLDNKGWTFDRPSHVYIVPTDGTALPRNLTPGEFQHHGIAWTPDSQAIFTSAARHPTWDTDFASDLYRVGLDATIVKVTPTDGDYYSPAVSPDGATVACIGYIDAQTQPQNAHIALVAVDTCEVTFVSRGIDRSFECTTGTSTPSWIDDVQLLATHEDRGTTRLARLTTGAQAPEQLTHGAATVASFDAAGGTIAFVAGAVDDVRDVFVLTDDKPRRLTEFAETYRATGQPLGWERFTAPCSDGSNDIDAWIMRPAGFDATKTYPMLLDVHGGPHTQYGETMFDEAQVQAAAGFVVLMCNPRGGSGREEAWGQSIMGPRHPVSPGSGWGSVDVDDVLAVLDTALDRYRFCDPTRVGMIGGSYGGFMATQLAGQHGDRFAAICSERAVNNMITEEFTSDIGTVFRAEVGPNHLDAPDEYERFSPIRFVRNISVPMLILHSENDLRCPISQAEELFVALRLLGKDVTFYRFPGEGHELTRTGSPVHRVQRAVIVLDWFADKLRAS